MERRDNLLAVRFFLAFGVMLMHVSGWRWLSFPWVAAFIGISGYLVCGSMDRSRGVGHFAWKRFLRVGPAFLASFVLVALLGGFQALWPTLRTWATMGSNNAGSWNRPLWSLSVEEVLYAFLALWFALGFMSGRRRATVFLGVFGVACAAALVRGHPDLALVPLGYAFAASCLLYFWRDRVVWSTPLAWVSLALGAACFQFPHSLAQNLFQMPLVTYGVLCLSLHARPWLGGWKRLGDLSFGMYCYHWPLMTWLAGRGMNGWLLVLGVSAGSFSLAFASWRWLEEPVLRLKDWRPAWMPGGRVLERACVRLDSRKIP